MGNASPTTTTDTSEIYIPLVESGDYGAGYTADGGFVPPYAPRLTGKESFLYSIYKLMRNPIEGFGPLVYNQPIVTVKHMKQTMHVISDPVGMMEVLAKQAHCFSKAKIDARLLGPATKEGLLAVHGDQWRKQRRAVAPMFQHRHMADLAPLITEAITEFKDTLAHDPNVELNTAMAELTFDVLAKALLGDPEALDRDRLKVATRRVVTSAGTLRPDDMVPMPRWMPRPVGPRGTTALNRLKKAADDLIEKRSQTKNHAHNDLVGLLTSAIDPKTNAPLTRREQRDNLIGFFIAGHETTALTLTWALYLVGMHQPTLERIRKEVLEITGTDDITYEKMGELAFTRAVIDETMRLYPPAPIMNREAISETEILDRKVNIGDHVMLANYVMHRRDTLWEKPKLFDPDRFLRDPKLKSKGAAYMPFGAGPRICVGAAFAVMESVMALATLVRDYDISLPTKPYPRPLMTVTLRPEGGIPAVLTKRS